MNLLRSYKAESLWGAVCRRFPYLLVVLVTFSVSLPADEVLPLEEPKQTLIFGYLEFPPFYYTNEQGEPEGPLVDMAYAIAHKAGYGVRMVSMPPKRAINFVSIGEIELWLGLASNVLYKQNILVSQFPVEQLELKVFSDLDMTDFTLEQLHGRNVVVERGYSYGGFTRQLREPENDITLVEVNSLAQGVNVLRIREMDYLVAYQQSIDDLVETQKNKPLLEKPLNSYIVSYLPVHMTLYKDMPNAEDIMAELEQAQRELMLIKQ